MAEKMKMLRDHGQSRKYYHDIEGYNGRLDALQAGILHVKLGHLKSWNELRRSKAVEYNRLLANCDAVGLPWEPSWSRGVYHLYVIRTSDREGIDEASQGCGNWIGDSLSRAASSAEGLRAASTTLWVIFRLRRVRRRRLFRFRCILS